MAKERRTNRFVLTPIEQLESRTLLTTLVDLDADGDLDAVTDNAWYENVDGRGNFRIQPYDTPTPGPAYFVGGFYRSVAVADVDSDGDPDIVRNGDWLENVDGQGDTLRVHQYGDPDTARHFRFIKVTDLGHDGTMDIIRESSPSFGADDVVHRNLGDGTFVDSDEELVGRLEETGDLDGDGDLDWVETTCLTPLACRNGSYNLVVHKQQDDGSFQQSTVPISVTEGASVRLIDMDGDGFDDVFIADYRLATWLRNDRGQISPLEQWTEFDGDGIAHIVDIDRDGDLEWSWHDIGLSSNWTYTPGRGGLEGKESYQFSLDHDLFSFSDIGDIDSDGSPDFIHRHIAAGWKSGATGEYHEKLVLIGDSDGNGKFDSGDLVTVFQAGKYEDGIDDNATYLEGDWNGDGDFDSRDFVFAFQAGNYTTSAIPLRSQIAAAVDLIFVDDDDTKTPRAFVA